MLITDKIDITNLILIWSKKYHQLLSKNKFLLHLYNNLIKTHKSLYFYKCVDFIYALNKLAEIPWIRDDSDFWTQMEDLIMRMKRDLTVEQILEVCELYAKISLGSNIFWGEIESYLIVNSSELKNELRDDLVLRAIKVFHIIGKSNETFWNIYFSLFNEFESKYDFKHQLLIFDSFATQISYSTIQAYYLFDKKFLP